MRTVPASMTWEVLARGRWHLLLATLGVIAFPAMFLMALRQSGPVDSHDASMLNVHILMMCTNVFIFGAALYGAQGRVSRLYTYPLRTSAIVAWRLLPAMLIMAVQMVFSTAILNTMFDLQWPIWGPAMFAAVSFAAVVAVAWLTEKSAVWMAISMAIVAAVLGLWFRSRYGGVFSEPRYFWQHVTPTDDFSMLMLAAAAYWVAVKAIARNRCGELPLSLGLVDRLYRTLSASSTSSNRLGTPFQAQCWHEWRRKGWALPAAMLICLALGLVGWLLGSRRADDLFLGCFVQAAGLTLLGVLSGIIFGNVGPVDSDFAMGTFLASRPHLRRRYSPRHPANRLQKHCPRLVDLGHGFLDSLRLPRGQRCKCGSKIPGRMWAGGIFPAHYWGRGWSRGSLRPWASPVARSTSCNYFALLLPPQSSSR